MSKSVLELAVGTGQWNAGLKKAKSALDNFTQSQGGLQQALAKDSDSMQKFVRMMGQADSTAKTAKGQMNDYKSTIEQLTMQYNRMTDAQKKSVGQEYLHAIDQMKQKYQSLNEEVRQMNQSLNNTKLPDSGKGATGLFGGLFGGGKLDGMLQVFGGNLMTKAAGWATSFASEMGEVVKQSVELAKQGEGIRLAFERLGRGDILDGLRQATHGTVTDIELMKAAVKFNDFKLPVEELGTMLAFAQQKAKDTGQSVDYMVDSIVTGLGRKSLMILDNLGLSANEVKEKMKETGDMTKAVGEIIREQMSKAGDYVETAADRATQADVELKNAMEELGRTLAPLTETGTIGFAKMETAMVKMANEVSKTVAPAVNDITSRFDLLTRKLYAQTMPVLVGVAKLMEKIRGGNEAGKGADIGKSLLGAAITPGANELPEVVVTGTMGGKGGRGGKGGKNDPVYAPDSIAYQEQLVSSLSKKWKEAGEAVRDDYKKQLEEAQYTLDKMTGKEKFDPSKMKEIKGTVLQAPSMEIKNPFEGMGKMKSEVVMELGAEQIKVDENTLHTLMKDAIQNSVNGMDLQFDILGKQIANGIEVPDSAWQSIIDQYNDLREQMGLEPITVNIQTGNLEELSNDAKVVKASFKDAASAVGNLGSALSGLDDPGAKIAGTVAQAIANIALAFSSADLKDGETGNVWYWIAATAAGLATMVSTISSIHAATNYAEGGMIKGNSYSGDNILGVNNSTGELVGLNAGEIVLNRAAQGNLAASLQGSGGGFNGQIVGMIEGEKIVLVANRWLKRSGQGEILTWKN